MNQAPLVINNIYKSFGQTETLNNINFSVNENEIFGFIGLNGAGKTTLIKIIIDLLECDSGNVNIFGQNHKDYNSRKNICYLPEKFQPSNYLTGIDFLKLNLGFHNVEFDLKKAEIISKNLDLNPKFLPEKISKFSKGMTQKIGLMSSFLTNNKLIILDEPMSGLDPKARINLKEQLLNYKKQGNSIFFSSHILSDIDEICDRIAILHNGKIIFIGDSKSLKEDKQTNNLEKAFIKAISS
ncbi:ATP-binding cassette domain-containing protein [Rickettsiales bacterium]|nr:ATP-binding cassette domain-containing protein [Rickettsiales bacterium]MDB2550824.1 ATP-binding cassette domain-containing protein [Rickettsiales bacterium]